MPVGLGPLLPSIRSPTNQRSRSGDRKIFGSDTAIQQPFSESDVNMISGTDLSETAGTTLRRAVVTLAPKRRSKFVCEKDEATPLPVPTIPAQSRRPRMRRSGQMSLSWRTGSDDRGMNTVRISPEILSAFNNAIGALGAPAKTPAHAVAYR